MNLSRIKCRTGDITVCAVDAIVNAANTTLLGGGGVDGAIHRAAGPRLLEACRAIGGCLTGEARITPAFDLPARGVIHTPGPVYSDGHSGEPELLAGCYRHALQLARDHDCQTVAFPSISCGIYGYPLQQACRIAIETTCEFLNENVLPREVWFVQFSADDHAVYESVLSERRLG